MEVIPKDTTIFCQPSDEPQLRELGFHQVIKVDDAIEWNEITIYRTSGQHGTGEIGEKMGIVSGFVLIEKSEPILYIAGDTIYCQEVEQALDIYDPNIVVVNVGAAQFKTGSPITMTAQDVSKRKT